MNLGIKQQCDSKAAAVAVQHNPAQDVENSRDESLSSIPEPEHDASSDDACDNTVADDREKEIIAKQESRVVFRLKLVVLLLLVLFAVSTALAVYFYINHQEEEQFRENFKDDAFKVLEAIGSVLEKTMGAYDSLALAIVSNARASQQPWPNNLTLPDFGIRAAKVLELSGAMTIDVCPIVTPETRAVWEEFAAGDSGNLAWVNESLSIQDTWQNYYGPKDQWGWEPYDVIHGDFDDVPYNATRIMLPNWQGFPLVVIDGYPPVNWDWYSVSNVEAMDGVLDRHTAVISEAYMLPKPDDPIADAETEEWAKWFKHFLRPGENPKEPVIDVYYPIVDELSQVNNGADPSKNKLVGMLASSLYWRTWIRDILPSSSKGLVIVFENPCNEAFTYQIDGPKETYLGTGDLHQPQYNHLGVHSALLDLKKFAIRGSKYTGAPVDEIFCPFTLHAYPSDDMYSQFSTSNGLIFALSAVAIFVFTSLVFILYDVYVEKRQRLVMNKAERSSAIVSSLFPSAVRDQLYVPKEAPKKPERMSRLSAFQSDCNKMRSGNSDDDQEKEPLTGSPIATLYENTTIMFADIAGFTHWSGSRQPSEVFMLLETLYGAFDGVARRRRVFKVETIGDCYVAVTGLPNPQRDHAVIMARFARDCLDQMNKIKVELEATLGAGTSDLALRIGLNSGPTTAGVLRGDKSRFQLFGDNVNTAARMESNSRPNQIMVSQSTADWITQAGKSHWLTPREDLVQAKGKGAMQCYWCKPKKGAGSSFSGNSSDMTLSSVSSEEKEGDDVEPEMIEI